MAHQEDDPSEYQAITNFRIRVLPVIAPMPAIVGNAAACFVLMQLAEGHEHNKMEFKSEPMTVKLKRKMLETVRVHMQLSDAEASNCLTNEEAETIVNACRGKSIISGEHSTGLIFVSWLHLQLPDTEQQFMNKNNLVLMTRAEAKKHLTEGGSAERNLELYGKDICDRVIHTLTY